MMTTFEIIVGLADSAIVAFLSQSTWKSLSHVFRVLLASTIDRLLAGKDDLCITVLTDQVIIDAHEFHIQTIKLECVLVRTIANSDAGRG
jgi:hypothetical protein